MRGIDFEKRFDLAKITGVDATLNEGKIERGHQRQVGSKAGRVPGRAVPISQ